MTTQKIEAFVRRGFDAYNAHQADPHWLDYEVLQIRNRKITRHATYYDALTLMQQLGVIPTT